MSTLHTTPHSCHSHIHHDTEFACLMGNGQKATGGLLYLRDESEKVRIPAIKSICWWSPRSYCPQEQCSYKGDRHLKLIRTFSATFLHCIATIATHWSCSHNLHCQCLHLQIRITDWSKTWTCGYFQWVYTCRISTTSTDIFWNIQLAKNLFFCLRSLVQMRGIDVPCQV